MEIYPRGAGDASNKEINEVQLIWSNKSWFLEFEEGGCWCDQKKSRDTEKWCGDGAYQSTGTPCTMQLIGLEEDLVGEGTQGVWSATIEILCIRD